MTRLLNARLGTDHKAVDIALVTDITSLREAVRNEWPQVLVHVEDDDWELKDGKDVLMDMTGLRDEFFKPPNDGGKCIEVCIKAPAYLFVRLVGGHLPIAVRTANCPIVGLFISSIKAMAPRLKDIDSDSLTLHLDENSPMLRGGMKLLEMCHNHPMAGRSEESPLVLKVQSAVDYHFPLAENPVLAMMRDANKVVDIITDHVLKSFKKITKIDNYAVNVDRPLLMKTKPMIKFTMGDDELFDLRLQAPHFETPAEDTARNFLFSSDIQIYAQSLALLIGPTGCGKTHLMYKLAQERYAIFIDASSFESNKSSGSVKMLKDELDMLTLNWNQTNQDLPACRRVAFAFLLTPLITLSVIREANPGLTPLDFLVYQLFNDGRNTMRHIFSLILPLQIRDLRMLRSKLNFGNHSFFWCIDEAHTLREHLDDKIITGAVGEYPQENGDVNENAKRGSLSLLINQICTYFEETKIILAGTSQKLRNVDNFGTIETKPISALVINEFFPWDSNVSKIFISSFFHIDERILDQVFTDYYRPRILENFVRDLLHLAENDNDSPSTRRKRRDNRDKLSDIETIVKESYEAVIHRFNRKVVGNIAYMTKKFSNERPLIQLLITSMISCEKKPIYYHLNEREVAFFNDTVGSIFSVENVQDSSFTLYEGFLIDALIQEFKEAIGKFNLTASIDFLKRIVSTNGKKSSAKGVPFETVCINELISRNWTIGSLCLALGIAANHIDKNIYALSFPKQYTNINEEDRFLQLRPNEWLQPSNLMRPDGITFPRRDVAILTGIKLYSRLESTTFLDNLASTDDHSLFWKSGRDTNARMRQFWVALQKKDAISFRLRLVFTFFKEPKIDYELPKNSNDTIYAMVNLNNMSNVFSQPTCDFLKFLYE